MRARRAVLVSVAALVAAAAANAQIVPKTQQRIQVRPTPTPTPRVQLQAVPVWKFGPKRMERELKVGAMIPLKPQQEKKKIWCGIYIPASQAGNPNAMSNTLWLVNNSGGPLPVGTRVEWKIYGEPASCCNGLSDSTHQLWPPNPPSEVWFWMNFSAPPQHRSRACEAWAVLP